jgi:hypothetical protein
MKYPNNLEALAEFAVEAFGSKGDDGPEELKGIPENTRRAIARRAAGRAIAKQWKIERLKDPTEDQIAGIMFGPGLAVWGWLWANRSAIWFVLKIVARILLSEGENDGGQDTTRRTENGRFDQRRGFPNDGTG